jgi:hypothetical protein
MENGTPRKASGKSGILLGIAQRLCGVLERDHSVKIKLHPWLGGSKDREGLPQVF